MTKLRLEILHLQEVWKIVPRRQVTMGLEMKDACFPLRCPSSIRAAGKPCAKQLVLSLSMSRPLRLGQSVVSPPGFHKYQQSTDLQKKLVG